MAKVINSGSSVIVTNKKHKRYGQAGRSVGGVVNVAAETVTVVFDVDQEAEEVNTDDLEVLANG